MKFTFVQTLIVCTFINTFFSSLISYCIRGHSIFSSCCDSVWFSLSTSGAVSES